VPEPSIQPYHFTNDATQKYREAFNSHPSHVVVIKNFLSLEVAQRLSRFLAQEAVFVPEYGLYSSKNAVDEKQFLAAADPDRFFRYSKLTGTASGFQMSPNAITYLRFRQAFQQPDFQGFFESISGLRLGWSDDFGAHKMSPGDFLRPHSDDNRNRRLALVIYLSPDWEKECGGVLHVVDGAANDTEILPEYNSMVAFDVLGAAQHYVSPINAGVRFSIGGWYHKPQN
jgi:Rps23 Pro-64 3,4-dihydroxylase Tpa1-like proline 4-hydroxylase